MSTASTAFSTTGFSTGDDGDFRESAPESVQRGMLAALIAATALLLVVYGNTLATTSSYWDDDTYSHGWLIPLIGIFLMWSQRRPKFEVTAEREKLNWIIIGVPFGIAAVSAFFEPTGETTYLDLVTWGFYCIGVLAAVGLVFYNHDFESCAAWQRWLGAIVFLAAISSRVYWAQIDMKPMDRLSFLAAAIGIYAAVGGFNLLRRMGVPLLFFVFMFPLPSKIEDSLLFYLQKLAATVSTIVLQIMGTGATLRGNSIMLPNLDEPLLVAEACSGMRMLTIFSAMTIAFVLVMKRPWWDKFIMLLSAIPIALTTNIIRIVITALLFLFVQDRWEPETESWFKVQVHDYAGYAMIFIALGLLFIELKVLSFLTVPEDEESGADFIG